MVIRVPQIHHDSNWEFLTTKKYNFSKISKKPWWKSLFSNVALLHYRIILFACHFSRVFIEDRLFSFFFFIKQPFPNNQTSSSLLMYYFNKNERSEHHHVRVDLPSSFWQDNQNKLHVINIALIYFLQSSGFFSFKEKV